MKTNDADPGAWTRRYFLERFGAVGGSAVLMSAMRSWDLMAQDVESRPRLTGRGSGKSVIVLGAGVSGLTTCYELNKLGYTVQILEARDRVGGVNWTVKRGMSHAELGAGGETQVCNFDEGLYVNGGPWRIPHTHTGVLDYCKELGVPLQLFVNEAEASYFYYEGAEYGPLANKRVRLREVKADMIGYTTELLAKAVNKGQIDVALSAEDKERLVQFLVTEGYLDSADYAYKGGDARGPGDPYNFSALLQSGFGSRARSVMVGTGQAPMFQPIGGMNEFPRGFQRALGDKIHLNSAIVSIRQTPENVRVVYRDTKTNQQHEAVADYVVSCLPLSILSILDVNLSPEMLAAVKATNYSPTGKMGLQMKRRFWEEDDRIFGGHLYSNLPFGEFSYPSNDFFTNKGIILGYYGNGRIENLHERPVKDRVEHVLMHGSKAHAQLRPEFENAYAVWWERIEVPAAARGPRARAAAVAAAIGAAEAAAEPARAGAADGARAAARRPAGPRVSNGCARPTAASSSGARPSARIPRGSRAPWRRAGTPSRPCTIARAGARSGRVGRVGLVGQTDASARLPTHLTHLTHLTHRTHPTFPSDLHHPVFFYGDHPGLGGLEVCRVEVGADHVHAQPRACHGRTAQPEKRIHHQPRAGEPVEPHALLRELRGKGGRVGPVSIAMLDGLVRDEPRVAAAPHALGRAAPAPDVRRVLIGHAERQPIHPRRALRREMEDELVAVVQEAVAVDRLVVPHGQVALEIRRGARRGAVDRDRLHPVDDVLQPEVRARRLRHIERRPRVARLGAHVEEERAVGPEHARGRLHPPRRPVEIFDAGRACRDTGCSGCPGCRAGRSRSRRRCPPAARRTRRGNHPGRTAPSCGRRATRRCGLSSRDMPAGVSAGTRRLR